MKRDFGHGSTEQFINMLENKIASFKGNANSENIESSESISETLSELERRILDSVGSKAGVYNALAINLGDGDFAWIFENDDGEFQMIGSSGNPIAEGDSDILDYISTSWGVESACNTSGISAKPDVYASSDNEVANQVLQVLKNEGYDVSNEEVINYADAAAELIRKDPEYTVQDWLKDTQRNYPEDLETLPTMPSDIESATYYDDMSGTDDSEYLAVLKSRISEECIENGLDVSFSQESEENLKIYVTDPAYGVGVDEYTVPLADLTLNLDTIEEDVSYIMNTILYEY